jgi:hypothetical protein
MTKRIFPGLVLATVLAAISGLSSNSKAEGPCRLVFQSGSVDACADYGCEVTDLYMDVTECCHGKSDSPYEWETPCPECCFQFSECEPNPHFYLEGDICFADPTEPCDMCPV